jgi:hypothetical protein
MSWTEQIFRYCERGADPAFWAEPVNALSNAAFLIAAASAARTYLRKPRGERGLVEAGLILLVAMMGGGSFLFHTFATRWASYADTGPIGLFMLAYLGYSLRRYFSSPWLVVIAVLAAFAGTLRLAASLQCAPALLPVTAAAGAGCLNGTAGYVPAFIAMLGLGIALAALRHPVWRHFLVASAIFALSMTLRTLDLELCAAILVAGRSIGTHGAWHILNATLLYVLLIGAIRHGSPARTATGR